MTTTVAVDCEALTVRLSELYQVIGNTPARARAEAEYVVAEWLKQGLLLDAAAVRHEHGERIAKEADRRAHNEDLYSQGPESEPGDHDYFRGRHDALVDLATYARDLSPPP